MTHPQDTTSEVVARLRAYRPHNEWGDPFHHTICDEAADYIEAVGLECALLTRWKDELLRVEKAQRVARETAETQLASLTKRVGELEGALTPSADTKADYIGEFQFTVTMMELDESDEPYECQRMVTVPWTTIKEIMGAISGRAARRLTGGEADGKPS